MPRLGVEFPGDLDIGLIVAALAVITLLVAFDAVRSWRRGRPRTRDDVVAAGAAAACTLLLLLTAAVPQLREPGTLLAGSAVVCCVAVAVLHRQVYPYLGARRSACLLTLRCLAVAAILLAVFRPTVQSASYTSARPMVAVLVDASQSMSVQDSRNGPSRYDRAVETCRRELADLADRLTADCLIFDTDVRPVDSPDTLPDFDPTGQNTDLAAALRAAVLATSPWREDQTPALIVLAVQNFGLGRSAVFTADTTSQWCLARKLLDQPVYHCLWGQMVRWLAKVDPSEHRGPAVQIRMGRSSYPFGEGIEVAAVVRDEVGQLVDRAQVTATIVGRDGDSRHIPMPRSTQRSGRYACTCPPPQPGRYRLSVQATKDGEPLGSDELDLFVEPPGDEMEALSLNQPLLEQIARASRGQYAALPELGRVLRGLLDGHAEQIAASHPRWSFNLFDHPFALLVGFAVLVTCEWLLRRRWQLQ